MHLQTSALRGAALVVVPMAYARAQTAAGASLGTLLRRSPGGPWEAASALWESAQIDTRWTQLAVDGLIAGSGGGSASMQLNNLALLGSFSPAPVGRIRWSSTAELNGDRGSRPSLQTVRRFESAISVSALGGGAWIGGGAEQGRDVDGRATKPLLLLGLWRPFGRTTFSVTSSSRRVRVNNGTSRQVSMRMRDSIFNDTTGHWEFYTHDTAIGDSSAAGTRDLRWTEVEARLGWASSRVAFDARLGLRPHLAGLRASSWGRVTTTVALAPRLALVAAAGNETALSSSVTSRASFVSIGLRVSPAALARPRPPAHVRPVANAFRALPADSGHYQIIVRATSARTVELSGDFDGWRPISLVQTRPDEWEATLAIAPGTYRVNMRVNGDRWTAPPGLPTAADEFNGTVGLLVIR